MSKSFGLAEEDSGADIRLGADTRNMAARDGHSFPTDYDAYAPTYAWARWAVPWVLEPLERLIRDLPADARVLEIGCGTANYICAAAGSRPDLRYAGFDVSRPMLQQGRARESRVSFVCGDASRGFPFPDRSFAFAFAVDVIHHVENLPTFFREACRVLVSGGSLVIITDSEDTLRRRSLTRFFPEVLPIELMRYPSIPALHRAAADVGLSLVSEEKVTGEIRLDSPFIARLEAKCSSAMRLLPPEEHAAGMARVRAAQVRDEMWVSCYDVLRYSAASLVEAR